MIPFSLCYGSLIPNHILKIAFSKKLLLKTSVAVRNDKNQSAFKSILALKLIDIGTLAKNYISILTLLYVVQFNILYLIILL